MGPLLTVFATLGGLFLWFAIFTVPILVYLAFEIVFQSGRTRRDHDSQFADTRVMKTNEEPSVYSNRDQNHARDHALQSVKDPQRVNDIDVGTNESSGTLSPFPELPLALVRPIATHASAGSPANPSGDPSSDFERRQRPLKTG